MSDMTALMPLAADVTPPPLLTVSGLEVSFGPVRALNGVDLAVQPGELIALAGENGAGKTTLVRCIAGDITPASGEIYLAGRKVMADPVAAARQGIAVVWQDLALCENLDVAANILLGQEPRRLLLSESRFHAAAAAVLADLRIPLRDTTRSIRTLSGGQRQLVAVARAMRHRPRLLALDEPTASLGVRESAQVEALIVGLRAQGTTILLACHDIEQMFRLADRIVVLRQGRIVGHLDPRSTHPDDVVALLSGQQVDSSARRQLSRLHRLADRLVSADPSNSLSLILSALGAALGTERLCIHLVADQALICAASLGFPPGQLAGWSALPFGPAGGPVGIAALTEQPVAEGDLRASAARAGHGDLAAAAGITGSWSVPVMGPSGLSGVITVFRNDSRAPQRDELDLVTLYAGYAASAVERDRLLDQVTARNRVLETIREMLETLAGPVPAGDALVVALESLRRGLRADEVALVTQPPADALRWRAFTGPMGHDPASASPSLRGTAEQMLADAHSNGTAAQNGAAGRGGAARQDGAARQQGAARQDVVTRPDGLARPDGAARQLRNGRGRRVLGVTFLAPGGPSVLLASWKVLRATKDETSLMEDAAHSLRLALEREEAGLAHQEAAALRRSGELQRGFLSRMSHELRTPLTAIRGYASSLMQPDVTWDGDSQRRFLDRIAAESARLGRLVDDLLDFSAIESGIMRLQRDWCDIPLVLEAAIACLPPADAAAVTMDSQPGLPAVWADHDRMEQVFVNLLNNAVRHNPPGTKVRVTAVAKTTATLAPADPPPGCPPSSDAPAGDAPPAEVVISVIDDGTGMPEALAAATFDSAPQRRAPSAGLGLSIAKAIVEAHGGCIELSHLDRGTCFRIRLPVEASDRPGGEAEQRDGLGGDGAVAAGGAGLSRHD
jgi:signal transduction histidine kinase/ABC-type multidrug transport system ATPase subunit